MGSNRLQALLNGEKVDRVPLYHFLLGFCARNVGYEVADMYQNPQKSYQAQAWAFEQYGIDGGPDYGYASYGGWEFGGEIKMPEGEWQQAPSHVTFPVNKPEDLDGLTLPDVRTAGSLPLAMEFSKLQQQNGTPITVILGGNFSVAGNICPPSTLCRWMLRKPDAAHRLLRMASDHILDVVRHWAVTFGAEKVIPNLWEPIAANDIISPKQFEQFALPYIKETNEQMLALGVKHILYHICGEQNANLPLWAQIPMGDPGLVTFGHQVTLTKAIEYFGESCIVLGNVNSSLIQTGTPQQVYEACRDAILEAKDAPRGFMLMSGCELPPMSAPYNVYMMKKAIEDFGRY
jgi:uroporphyrinogen decarboxylase